jgi:hypothetical protein
VAGSDWNQRHLPKTIMHCNGLFRSVDYEEYYLQVYNMFNLLLIVFIVAQMVEALCYKLEGRGFDSQWNY